MKSATLAKEKSDYCHSRKLYIGTPSKRFFTSRECDFCFPGWNDALQFKPKDKTFKCESCHGRSLQFG